MGNGRFSMLQHKSTEKEVGLLHREIGELGNGFFSERYGGGLGPQSAPTTGCTDILIVRIHVYKL